MPSKLTFLKIFLLSLLFTGATFSVHMYVSLYFTDEFAEDNYIEKSIFHDHDQNHNDSHSHVDSTWDISWTQVDQASAPDEQDVIKENLLEIDEPSARQIYFSYIPSSLRPSVARYRNLSRDIINDDSFSTKIEDLTVEFHKDMVDVRWRMKNKTIKIFDPLQFESSEFLALFTHEFAHYLDLYYFSRTPFWDISQGFYDVSWESTKTMRSWQDTTDFVSGYAMTNKYEDFAETLTYYIFHNNDFAQKARSSIQLQQKYTFLEERLFKKDIFIWTDFSPGSEVQPYYWDITKLPIQTENFLQYLQKDI